MEYFEDEPKKKRGYIWKKSKKIPVGKNFNNFFNIVWWTIYDSVMNYKYNLINIKTINRYSRKEVIIFCVGI